tara:strand:+ start:43253 stop:43795 length:543 start_codon:yes stop_codon:yes gene_type:complete
MDTFFLGIDPSATATGVSLIGSNSSETFLIRPGKRRDAERLQYIHTELKSFLEGKLIFMGVMEAPSYGSIHKEFILGEVLGVIKLTLIELGIFSISVPPTQLKLFLAGKGSASKEDMIKSAGKQGCPSTNSDICDSWGAALLCKDLLLPPEVLTRTALEVRKKVGAKHSKDIKQVLNKQI